jgi:hypothetical protein
MGQAWYNKMSAFLFAISLSNKREHPDQSLSVGEQLLQFSSVLKSEHRDELLFNHGEWFGMDLCRCPQGDSNPCLGLERAPSWATRRWGRLFYERARLYHSNSQSSTSLLAVPWTSVLAAICLTNRVHEKDVHFARSVHANSQGHYDVRGARGTCDHDRRSGLTDARQGHRAFKGRQNIRRI